MRIRVAKLDTDRGAKGGEGPAKRRGVVWVCQSEPRLGVLRRMGGRGAV